jgi:hypothetical protein
MLTKVLQNYVVDIEFQSKCFGMIKYVKFYYLKNSYLKTLSWKL